MMMMPGLGATYTPARTRLLLALALSLVILPIVKSELPPEPRDAAALFLMIAGEAIIGVFMGTISLIFMSVMETAGQLIAQQIGLSNAYIFNPQSQTQGSIPGTLLTMIAMVSVFATDLYQILLKALIQSYHVFRYDSFVLFGDMSDAVAHLAAKSFEIAVEMCAPFLIVSLMLYVIFGLIGRLMPQIQVFFVTLPLQIGLGCTIFGLVAEVIVKFWMASFTAALSTLGMGG